MALGGESTAIPACETTLTPSSTTSATLVTESGLNQSIKKLSISSLESLNNESDIVSESINQTTTTSSSKQQPESSTKPVSSSQQQTEDEYDYIKAGAKPKTTRNKQQKQTTSSASTSCSSLSSLVSQTSSAMTSSNKPSSSISSLSSSSQQRRNVMSSKTNQSRLMAPPDFPISDDIELTHQQQQNETRCPLCMKSIGDYDLEAHFQIEHREYECPFCGHIFDSEFTMQQHLSSAHSEATDNASGRISSREIDVFDDELLPMSAERLLKLLEKKTIEF